MCILGHLHGFEGFHDEFVAFWVLDFAYIEAEGDILGDGHVRPEGVGLEDHSCVSFVWGLVGDDFVVEGDGALGGVDESRDHSEEGCFAAA